MKKIKRMTVDPNYSSDNQTAKNYVSGQKIDWNISTKLTDLEEKVKERTQSS